MKKLMLLYFLLIPVISFAQDAPKKANRLTISNNKSADDNFALVKQTLADNDIEIASQDKDVHQIKSGQIIINKWGANGYYNFNCKEGKIVLTGFFALGYDVNVGGVITKSNFEKIRNSGGGARKEAWSKMNQFAHKLGSDITYEIVE